MKVEVELEELEELREQVDMLEHALANQTYNGNSIAYIYQKMKNYGDQAVKLHKLNQEMLKMLQEAEATMPCNCGEAYTSRGLTAPDCPRCNYGCDWDAAKALIAKAGGENV